MINRNKMLLSALFMAVLCSILVSSVQAATDDVSSEQSPDVAVPSDNPLLTATNDNATTTSENPTLIQQRDNSTGAVDPPAGSKYAANSDMLVATQSSPDYTGYIVASIVLVGVIVVCGVIIIVKRNSKNTQ
jgi:hypothetical protein